MQTTIFRVVSTAALISLALANATCYYPDGKNATGLVPCYPGASESHCCRDSDVCMSNGLCFSSGLGSLVRRGCTDKTWKSDVCPSICNIESFREGDAVLTPCGTYNDFCCGQDKAGRSCCDETGNTTLSAQVPGGEVICTKAAAVGPTSSVTSTVTVSATPTGINSAGGASASSEKTLKNTRTGLAAGLAIFAALATVAAACAWLFRYGKNKAEAERRTEATRRQTADSEKQTETTRRLAAEEERHKLEQALQRVDVAIKALPTPFRSRLEAARSQGDSP